MYHYSYIILLSFIIASVQAFFIHGEKEPLLFCIKVCPLYCWPQRRDDDASSLIYIDDFQDIPYHRGQRIPYHFDPYYWKPPKPTTTPPAPTTTPPAPTTTPPAPTTTPPAPTTTPPAPTTTPPAPTTTPPAPTTMTTTTTEPWICVLCMNKCRKYSKP